MTSFGRDWSASLRRGSETELQRWVDLAGVCCDLADELSLASFRREASRTMKPDGTYVTEVDRAIERLIRERISAAFPGHGLIGEEEPAEHTEASVRWYVDPIDGTHNYMRGIPLFGTLIAVERDGELQVGVMSAPALHERWVAWRGGGAWNRKGRLRASGISHVADATVLYTSRREIMASADAPGFDRVIDLADNDAALGDFWGYGLVADGAAEAMLDVGVYSWDVAAPRVVVEEAGGSLTDLHGRRSLDAKSFLATNGHVHSELLSLLARAEPSEPTPRS